MGHRSTPTPIPRGAARRGRRRRPPQHRWSKTCPFPQGPCWGNQGSFSLPPPHRKGHSGWGGNVQGSRGALCRPCVMSTGPQHASHARGTGGCGTAVAATTRGIPGCRGGGQRCLPVQGGGGGAAAATGHNALRRAGARTGSLVRGRGRGSGRAGSSCAAARGHAGAAARSREGLRGGHITRGGRPSAAPQHTGGPGVG